MGTARYFGEQDPRHKGTLQWPGVGGLPLRGAAVPLLKQQEMQRLATEGLVGDTYQQTFDLGKPDDASYYNWIRNRARNGWFTIDHIKRRWNNKTQSVHIYLEWTQVYIEIPPNKILGAVTHGFHNNFTLRGAG